MIPAQIDPATRSPGEVEIYNRLESGPGTESWTVLHSLDVPNHRRQITGEIDFLIIVPGTGVLCLEVKGARRIRREADGLWYYGSGAKGDPRGPFKQAAEAMYSVRNRLLAQQHSLASVLFCAAACFPYVEFTATSEEWHDWQVIDRRLLDAQPISALIRNIFAKARQHAAGKPAGRWLAPAGQEPTAQQCAAIIRALRPQFEFFESPRSRRRERDEQLRRYTEDQFAALDAMSVNPRVVFEGAAGTGKTLLGLEEARRASMRGEHAFLCCFNRLLGSWLKREAEPFGSAVRAGTLHSFMLEAAGISPPQDATASFWQDELPERAAEALLDGTAPTRQFDLLIVDEAQDLLRDGYLDVLDLILTGGLLAGRWRFFGDFLKQAIYNSTNLSLAQFLEQRSPGVPRYRLTANCRNTPRIASFIELLGGVREGYQRILRPDNGVEPDLRFFAGPQAQPKALAAVLERLRSEGYAGNEVTVLSPRAHGCCAEQLGPPWQGRLRPAGAARGGQIAYCSIHAFKGLESPAIVVTDIGSAGTPEDESLFYVAITRATERLVVLADARIKEKVIEMLVRLRSDPAHQALGG